MNVWLTIVATGSAHIERALVRRLQIDAELDALSDRDKLQHVLAALNEIDEGYPSPASSLDVEAIVSKVRSVAASRGIDTADHN
jgi:hypothetical protein